MKLPIELCKDGAVLPTYANVTDAGMDVYAIEDTVIYPGEIKIIPTGIKMAIPVGYEVQVRDRSGLASSTRLRVANAPGTVDAGYRDEVGVIIENTSTDYFKVAKFLGVELPPMDIITCPLDKKAPGFIKHYDGPYVIKKGDRIAQLVVNKIENVETVLVESVAEIGESRGGGFGSTGVS